jgi:hypothetical protein
MTSLHEPVYLRFRGRTKRLPLLAIAVAMRRDGPAAATALEILINGPPADPAPLQEQPSGPHHDSRGEGVGGGVYPGRSQRGAQRSEPKPIEENVHRSERSGSEVADDEAFARSIAVDLGDEGNVASIRKLVALHSRDLIERACRAALLVPAHRVRSSRGAIFTAVVRRLADESHSRTNTTL